MVHITRANSKQILSKVDFKKSDFKGNIYKIPIDFFNRYEEQNLLAFRALMENPNLFYELYCKIDKYYDDKIFVFQNAIPAYHMYKCCPNLHANFFNYYIPNEIKERGDSEIQKYRSWFKEVAYLLESGDDLKTEIFLERCRLRFNLNSKPQICNKNNSGIYEIENLDLEKLEDRINSLLCESNEFFEKSSLHSKVLGLYSKNSYLVRNFESFNHMGVGVNATKSIVSEFDRCYKMPIYYLLKEWYRVKFNPELTFEGHLLDQLGFNPCRHCHNPYYSPTQDEEQVCDIEEI